MLPKFEPKFDAAPEVEETPKPLLRGLSSDIVSSNVNTLKQGGQSEFEATRVALKARKHPLRHKNLGKFLHPKKS